MFSADVLDYLPTPFRYNCRGLGIFTKRVRLNSRLALPDIKTNMSLLYQKKDNYVVVILLSMASKKNQMAQNPKMAGH